MLEAIRAEPAQHRVYRVANNRKAAKFLREQGLDDQGIEETIEILEAAGVLDSADTLCEAPFKQKRRFRLRSPSRALRVRQSLWLRHLLDWLDRDAPDDYARYEAMPVNATAQTFRRTARTGRRVPHGELVLNYAPCHGPRRLVSAASKRIPALTGSGRGRISPDLGAAAPGSRIG